jgi:DNA-binding MarR family transcriptional regulator
MAAFDRALPDLQDATDTFDDAAAEALGVNRTDLRVLGVVVRGGRISPSALADAAGLSRGAMTTALDRLEAAGYTRRTPNPQDRRGLTIEATPEAFRRCVQIWGPLAEQSSRVLKPFSTDELEKLVVLLQEVRAIQLSHVERVRNLDRSGRGYATSQKKSPSPGGGPAKRRSSASIDAASPVTRPERARSDARRKPE